MAAVKYRSSGRQKIRMFLEGREVPVTQVTITVQIGQPAQATADMVPLQILKFIRPRTQVHVFVRDTFAFGDDNFYLAFEGEVLGRTMVKRHDGRFLQLLMFDYSNYWEDSKVFMMNPQFLMGKAAPEVLNGGAPPADQAKAAAASSISTASTAQSQMITYLTKQKDSDGNVDLVKGAASVALMLASVNEFYRANYERLRIMDRLVVKSGGRTAKFLAGLKVEEFLTSYTGSHGGLSSLRELLNGVMSLIFHEFVSVPFPSRVKVSRGKETGNTVAQFMFIPDSMLLPPPKCNVIFPSQQIGFEYADDFRAAPTRYGFRFSFPMVADANAPDATYLMQYYPKPFADYMTGALHTGKNKQSTDTDLAGGFGPSRLLSVGSKSFFDLFYGAKGSQAVGTSYATKLRESDFLSNEESLRGIYYTTDVMSPNYTALVRSGGVSVDATGKEAPLTDAEKADMKAAIKTRNVFMYEIGAYLFMKKRYGARQVSASIMFNPFIVPGFNMLFLDDSAAGQSFLAKCQTITHVLSHTGFTTGVGLAYARDYDEVDFMTGGTGDPPLPGWFDPTLFGVTETYTTAGDSRTNFNMETKFLGPPTSDVSGREDGQDVITEEEVQYRDKYITNPTVFPKLSTFYQSLVGCDAITTGVDSDPNNKSPTKKVLVTTRGSTLWLINEYVSKANQDARDQFVRSYIKRPVVNMLQAFEFIGAAPQGSAGTALDAFAASVGAGAKSAAPSPLPEEWAKFVAITDPDLTGLPGRFDGVNPTSSTNYSDKAVLESRRKIVDPYVAALQKQRGFRG